MFFNNAKLDGLFAFFEDPAINEILINDQQSAWVQTAAGYKKIANPFRSSHELMDCLQEFSFSQGQRLDPLYPATGGSLGEGEFRWHCLLPPLSVDGVLFSLRRHRFKQIKISDFADPSGFIPSLEEHFQSRGSLMICGPTGCGKTTLLAALCSAHCPNERIFCLEKVLELPALSEQWLRLVERPPNIEGAGAYGLDALLSEALRLKPDRLVLGEIRGSEARIFLKALLTGHKGLLTTLHASSVTQVLQRLKELSGELALLEILQEEKVGVVVLQRGCPPVVSDFKIIS